MIVLVIDPGSRHTGYAFIKRQKSKFILLEGGVISTVSTSKSSPKYNLDIPQRLLIIHNELATVIDKYQPDTAAY